MNKYTDMQKDQYKTDIIKVGLVQFKSYIRSTSPGDVHPNWIYFNAIKQ